MALTQDDLKAIKSVVEEILFGDLNDQIQALKQSPRNSQDDRWEQMRRTKNGIQHKFNFILRGAIYPLRMMRKCNIERFKGIY